MNTATTAFPASRSCRKAGTRREALLAAGPAVPRLPQAREALQRLHRQELRRGPDPVRPVPRRRDRPAGRRHAPAAKIDRRRRSTSSSSKCEPLTVREFLAYLYAQNYTKSTTARKLATLRSFYKFLIRRGLVSVNPLSTIRTPKQEKRLPKCLDLEQVQKLLDAPGDGDILARPRQGDARSPLQLRHPRQRTGRAGDAATSTSRRRPPRPRQGPQGPPHADRQPGDQGAAAVLRDARRSTPQLHTAARAAASS